VSEKQERPIVAYTLSAVRKAVGHGATAPEIGDVAAIIKQDGDESPHCVYNEIVALRQAQTLHIPVADGALTLTPDGHTYVKDMLHRLRD
jgi:hypothetical protein